MEKSNSWRPVFRPYEGDGLKPLTLRQVLRDEYLYKSVMWLLGYDGAKPLESQKNDRPLRAQEMGSPWQTGNAILVCLEARTILQEELKEEREPLIEEIDRKLLAEQLGTDSEQGAIHWLLNQVIETAEPDQAFAHWDERLYDTAIVIRSLILIHKQYGSTRNPDARYASLQALMSKATKALRWICHRLTQRDALDQTENDALSQVVLTFVAAKEQKQKEFEHIFKEYEERLPPNPLNWLCMEICNRSRDYNALQESGDRFEEYREETAKPLIWDDHNDVIEALNAFHRWNAEENGVWCERLRRGLRYLEILLRRGISHHGPRSSAIGVYVEAASQFMDSKAATPNPEGARPSDPLVDRNLVLANLYKSCASTQRFEDGSVFHDVYSTVYLAEMLVQVLRHFGPASRESTRDNLIITLYDDALLAITAETRISQERRQIYLLQSDQQALKRQLDASEKKRKHGLWYASIFYVLYALILLGVILMHFLPKLQLDENVALIIAVASILMPLVYGFVREQDRE